MIERQDSDTRLEVNLSMSLNVSFVQLSAKS